MVITLDSESSDPSSNLGGTFFFNFFCPQKQSKLSSMDLQVPNLIEHDQRKIREGKGELKVLKRWTFIFNQ